jgi:general secretion pathway protein C
MAALPRKVIPERHGPFGTLVTLLLVIALAWLLARWTWVFVAPPPAAASGAGSGGVDLGAVARLFGAAPPSGAGASSGASSGIRLKGVVAPWRGDEGSAVFNLGGRDIAVSIGGELQPGVTLVAVERDHAVIARAGVRERVDLDVRMAAVPRGSAGQAPGFRLSVSRSGPNDFTFSRNDLESALKDPGQLKFLGRIGVPPGGGVRLDEAPPGSLAARLGLQPGDIIRKVNGQAVSSAGDLARLHQQFSTTSLVQAEVQRGTATLQINYTINP